ncbi:GNAT family N-acetyltransferase [Rhodobacterales bacterium HKCCE3408]|nr:GNAT family N-acetyltransferase [Rhodobacterales bacterium HKCCE3408]
MTILRTDRLVLRRARMADAADMHEIFSDPEPMRFWSQAPHASMEETERWLAAVVNADPASSDDFIVERDGKAIGKCGVWKAPEIGIMLHPGHWRQGLGREAMAAVIAHIFATRDWPEITADIDPDNAASLALFEGLGFRRTGYGKNTFHFGGKWYDSVYLALPRQG